MMIPLLVATVFVLITGTVLACFYVEDQRVAILCTRTKSGAAAFRLTTASSCHWDIIYNPCSSAMSLFENRAELDLTELCLQMNQVRANLQPRQILQLMWVVSTHSMEELIQHSVVHPRRELPWTYRGSSQISSPQETSSLWLDQLCDDVKKAGLRVKVDKFHKEEARRSIDEADRVNR